MKYIKLFAVALGLAVMTSCSDDKSYNTAQDVTVEMGKAEVSVKEHSGRFYLPINVTGEANGDIKVTVKVEGVGSNPAQPFEDHNGAWSGNYIVTSETINIPKGETSVDVEISAVDDKEINDDRTFTVTLEKAEGAKIGNPASTVVTLQDNDKVPYERIQGEWTLNYRDWNNIQSSLNFTLSGYAEGSIGYGHSLKMEGMWTEYAEGGATTGSLYFFDDEASDTRYVEIVFPQTIGKYVSDPSMSMWLLYAADSKNGIQLYIDEHYIVGQVSADYQTITFDEGVGFVWWIDNASFTSEDAGGINAAMDIVMTRR